MKETVTRIYEIQWELIESIYIDKRKSFDNLDDALSEAKNLLLNSEDIYPTIQIKRTEIQINT